MFSSDDSCPACGSARTLPIRRKYVVTTLRECLTCGLRFRFPKDDAAASTHFYQTEYSEGFTTDLPSDQALANLVAAEFRGSEKDFSLYLSLLTAAGLRKGDSILDFGASWGYGSWQFARLGFEVFSYEIDARRADYAHAKLGCKVVAKPEDIPKKVNCLFSAHVIEHLPDPNVIWQVADKVLAPDGVVICLCPNGEPAREAHLGLRTYDQLWGCVHPLLITPAFFLNTCDRYGWLASCQSSPFSADRSPERGDEGVSVGEELCMFARRRVSGCPTEELAAHRIPSRP